MFEDLLGVEKVMVTCHKSKNLKYLVFPSRMKVCMERDLRASAHVKNQTGNVVGFAVKDRVKDTSLDDGFSSDTRERENKTLNWAGRMLATTITRRDSQQKGESRRA